MKKKFTLNVAKTQTESDIALRGIILHLIIAAFLHQPFGLVSEIILKTLAILFYFLKCYKI